MEFAHDGGINWRKDMTAWLRDTLGHASLDPSALEHDQLSDEDRLLLPALRRTDLDRLRPIARKIIRYDIGLVLNHCDYLICYWTEATQLGCGTAGEITLATWIDKPVYMILDYPRDKASTWMVGCTASIHSNFDELKSHLIATYGKHSHARQHAPPAQAR